MKRLISLFIILILLFTIVSCKDNSFVVSFIYPNYEEENYSIEVKSKTYLAEPTKTNINGLYVSGWYTTSDFLYKWDFPTDLVNKDLKLYAKLVSDNRIINIPKEKNITLGAILSSELRKSFDFFYETSSTSTKTFGLARDRYSNLNLSSIASTGYGLCSNIIGAENGYITHQEAYDRTFNTLITVLSLSHKNGFFYHFMSLESGIGNSEISVIDTALFMMSAIAAGEYFGSNIKELVDILYTRINWNFYINQSTNKFYMGYDPKTNKFSGAWDRLGEQLIMYILAGGGDTSNNNKQVYDEFSKIVKQHVGTYQGLDGQTKTLYQTYNGALFLHQYSQAFIYFNGLVDKSGIDYYLNGLKNTEAHIVYTKSYENVYKTYIGGVFGLSAGDSPSGYTAFGAKPAESNPTQDGTIHPYASLASINYYYMESMKSITKMYSTPSVFQEKYGFISGYNLGKVNNNDTSIPGVTTPWYSNDYIGIDKGSAMVMIENYRSNLFYRLIMQNEYVQKGLFNLGFDKI